MYASWYSVIFNYVMNILWSYLLTFRAILQTFFCGISGISHTFYHLWCMQRLFRLWISSTTTGLWVLFELCTNVQEVIKSASWALCLNEELFGHSVSFSCDSGTYQASIDLPIWADGSPPKPTFLSKYYCWCLSYFPFDTRCLQNWVKISFNKVFSNYPHHPFKQKKQHKGKCKHVFFP